MPKHHSPSSRPHRKDKREDNWSTVDVAAQWVHWQTRRCPFAKPVPTQNQDLKREDDWSTVSVTAESVQWQTRRCPRCR